MKKLSLLLLCSLFVACSSHKAPSDVKSEKPKEKQKDTSCDNKQPSEAYQRNHRYASVYGAFDGFKWIDRLLIVKMNSKEVSSIIEDLDKTSKNIKEKLEELQKGYPRLSFEDNDRSEVSIRKNKIATEARLKSFMPLVGKQGEDFERSLLLFISTTTNELKFRLQALSELEPNENLKKFDDEMHDEVMRLEDRTLKLLNQKYFKKNYFKPQSPEKK